MVTQSFSSVGVDIGKNTFHIVGLDQSGAVALRSRHSRTSVVDALIGLSADRISMEACGSAHDLARRLKPYCPRVQLLVAADVRAFVRTQKNDYNDAQAIAEAGSRPTVRTVAIKTVEQQDLQLLHRMRSRWVAQRTALINQLRAMLLECGITAPQGRRVFHRRFALLLSQHETDLTPTRIAMLTSQREAWLLADTEIARLDAQINCAARQDPRAVRLMTIPGVGPLTATALLAAAGDAQDFRHARDLAAWLGLIPQQHSTGGQARLGRISKRGNRYLRWLFVHGARSACQHLKRDQHDWGEWIGELEKRMHKNKVHIAVAAKLARLCWCVLRRSCEYQPHRSNPSATGQGTEPVEEVKE